ncbi:hypothetical protein LTR56_003630 [Elasticomyces elasticus]|nr:hypothetical protein LTR56_003630 [Elasticomyces elasticus]KAK3663763.1 hypothetical protein LTR22_005464 [Elasticomyces elasticus]KAK4927282.1 hypothetical protein LTR49_005947 [Elasticomyces elasticus]KAK5767312.1 hypothetical protein LTS12_002465 [Elasticomyces elasticus]
MGVTGLWDTLNDAAEIVHIAEYAARHFEQHKRPLRIAVDEACWRFTNLTPEQVERIREGEPAANPVEKTILWRALNLMKLNIQLIFVSDGPRRPWKRAKRGGGLIDRELTKLLYQMLDHLKLPRHQAPSGAEAECAVMQKRGLVDAVWTDDGDAFMFGATVVIKAHKIGKDRVKDHIKVFTAERLRNRLNFDADSFILFALLSGGDYCTKGLPGCGPQTARLENQLPIWREALKKLLRLHRNSAEVPAGFPEFKALENYRDPIISTPEQLDDLRGLRQGWDRPIDQRKLRILLRDRFHFGTREYLKHIAPTYLARALARATPEQRVENLQYEVVLKRTQKRKTADGEGAPPKAMRKIMFLAAPAVEINLSERPPEEDWSAWDGKDGTPYDPMRPIEGEVLDCFLRHGLPEDALVTAPPPTRKRRKVDEEDDAEILPAPKKARAKKTSPASFAAESAEAPVSTIPASSPKPTRERNKAATEGGTTTAPKRARKKKGQAVPEPVVERPASPPRVGFRRPNIPSELFNVPSQGSARSMSDDERYALELQAMWDAEDREEEQPNAADRRMPQPCDVVNLDYDSSDQEPQFTWPTQTHDTPESPLFVTPLKAKSPPALKVKSPANTFTRTVFSGSINATNKATTAPAGSAGSAKGSVPETSSQAEPNADTLERDKTESGLVPGQVIAPSALRELRAATFLSNNFKTSMESSRIQASLVVQPQRVIHEIIDLT